MKVISLMIACSLWFYVLNREQMESMSKSPIKFLLPQEYGIENSIPNEVVLKLRGARAFIRNLPSRYNEIAVDLTDEELSNGETKIIKIDPSRLVFPFGIKLVDWSPKEIEINFGKLVKRQLPIRLAQKVGLDPELKIVQEDFSPKKVTVIGPNNLIKKMSYIETEEVDLNSLKEKGELPLNLVLPDERLQLELSKTVFKYEIRAKKSNKTLNNFPIKFLASQFNFKAEQEVADLEVLVTNDAMQSMNDIRLIAEIPESKAGVYRVKLNAQTPKGIYLLKISPEYINVTVK